MISLMVIQSVHENNWDISHPSCPMVGVEKLKKEHQNMETYGVWTPVKLADLAKGTNVLESPGGIQNVLH